MVSSTPQGWLWTRLLVARSWIEHKIWLIAQLKTRQKTTIHGEASEKKITKAPGKGGLYEVSLFNHMNAKVYAFYQKIKNLSIMSFVPTLISYVVPATPAVLYCEVWGLNGYYVGDYQMILMEGPPMKALIMLTISEEIHILTLITRGHVGIKNPSVWRSQWQHGLAVLLNMDLVALTCPPPQSMTGNTPMLNPTPITKFWCSKRFCDFWKLKNCSNSIIKDL